MKLGLNIRIEPQQKYIQQELDTVKNQQQSLMFISFTVMVFLTISITLYKLSCIDNNIEHCCYHELNYYYSSSYNEDKKAKKCELN